MGSDWYSIHMEARASADAQFLTVDEDAADILTDLLEEHDGVVSAGTGTWDATISVQAANAWEATGSGLDVIEKLADKAGMPNWPAVRVDVLRQDVLEAENRRPTLPELVSGPEAAEILGVSPQRLRQLADGHASFPEPMYDLRAGRLWLKDAVEAFDRRWDRKPGRPRRSATARLSRHGPGIPEKLPERLVVRRDRRDLRVFVGPVLAVPAHAERYRGDPRCPVEAPVAGAVLAQEVRPVTLGAHRRG